MFVLIVPYIPNITVFSVLYEVTEFYGEQFHGILIEVFGRSTLR